VRTVPLPKTLRVILAEHVERTGRRGADLLFGRTSRAPFTPSFVQDKADAAWVQLERVTLHECRHSYSTYLDAAGVSRRAPTATWATRTRASQTATGIGSKAS
jgi:integrase